MKAISIGFENALLKEINKKAKQLNMTRTELVRNAILEFLFGFDDKQDAKLLMEAVSKNEPRKKLSDIKL